MAKNLELRKTFAVREVLRIDARCDDEPYISRKIGGGQSFAINLADNIQARFEDILIEKLGIKKGDKIEFVMTVRKLEK